MLFKVALLCLSALAVSNGQYTYNLQGNNLLGISLPPIRPLTLTVTARRQTTTWIPSCWVTADPAPTETCSDIRRRRGIQEESQEAVVADESDYESREPKQLNKQYGFFYPESSMGFRNQPQYNEPYYPEMRQRPRPRPTLLAVVTRTLAPHSVVATKTNTVTIDCLYPSLITKCPMSTVEETPAAPVSAPEPESASEVAPEGANEVASEDVQQDRPVVPILPVKSVVSTRNPKS